MSQPQHGSQPGHERSKSSIARCLDPPPKGPWMRKSEAVTRIGIPASLAVTPAVAAAAAAQMSPPESELPLRIASPATRSQPTHSPNPRVDSKPKDFSFLLRPEIYHPLAPLNVAAPFRNPAKQPAADATIEELLARGHFRAAAIAAAQELTGSGSGRAVDPRDAQKIFQLLYTRLACLTLIDATPLAAQEVKALEDLNDARRYVDAATGRHLAPWELRVLNVRLQALGFGDPRRAVMSYHDLAREARDRAKHGAARHDNSAKELWKARLHDLGIKTAGALIDMDDLCCAAHHLKSLRDRGDGKLAFARALLFLQIGDVDSARTCAEQCSGDAARTEAIILALCDMADSDFEAALEKWLALEDCAEDEMVKVNAAVCLLFLGRIQEVCSPVLKRLRKSRDNTEG
ncbi:hypothetical protein ESCO_002034 [Escovopsis weberi]|uniref:Trafficking protein particle complex subunit 12 n=1 Tax=Escovopsis weberi TaxID=150374 RepID=A0A0N0RU01_ESCWE|nr:hypothetical protein ESCO_002034 [Escovopsis weberi]